VISRSVINLISKHYSNLKILVRSKLLVGNRTSIELALEVVSFEDGVCRGNVDRHAKYDDG
jgi:hypothetical protein